MISKQAQDILALMKMLAVMLQRIPPVFFVVRQLSTPVDSATGRYVISARKGTLISRMKCTGCMIKDTKTVLCGKHLNVPFVNNSFFNATALQEHIDNTHADEHESLPSNLASIVSGVSVSFGDLRRDSISYSCEYANEYEYEDAEVNTGDDLVSSSLNLEESNELFRKRTKQNLKDISFQEDSDIDEAWTPEEEKHECNFFDFVTSYEYSLIRHKKTHEKSKQKSAPKRKLADVESVSNKRMKDDTSKERIQTYCNIREKEFANNFSYRRHC